MRRCLGCMREYDEQFDLCPECGYVDGTPAESMLYLAPGTRIGPGGRFLLGKVLGQGGFGITYIAWDSKLDFAVAIKEYMPRAIATRLQGEADVTCYNDDARQQFNAGLKKMLNETRTLAKFHDLESVVHVYDCFEENGTAYIIMELLRGRTLEAYLKENGALSYEETIVIIHPVLEALQQIHRTGLIHRDISPSNIFLCDNGKIKLLDFGSAHVVTGMDQKERSVVLKPGFAPKEQYSARGAQGSWTDLYSVAATMYKMLTGETPVDSLSRSAADDPLEPIGQLARIPDDAAEALMDALAVEPEDRIQTAGDLLKALYGSDKQTTPKGSGNRGGGNAVKKILCIAAAIVVVVGGAAALKHFGVIDTLSTMIHRDDKKVTQSDYIPVPDVSPTADTKKYAELRSKLLKDSLKTAQYDVDPQQNEAGYMRILTDEKNQTALTETYTQDSSAPGGMVCGSSRMVILNEQGDVQTEVLFDKDGQITQVTENTFGSGFRPESTARYDADGKMTGCEQYFYQNNDLYRTFAYDGDQTCISRETTTSENGRPVSAIKEAPEIKEDETILWTEISETAFDYNDAEKSVEQIESDAEGNPLRIDARTGDLPKSFLIYRNKLKSEEETYTYDAAHRLTEKRQYKNDSCVQFSTLTYDEAGNLAQIVWKERNEKQLSAVRLTYAEDSSDLTQIAVYNAADQIQREQNTDGSCKWYEYQGGNLKYAQSDDAEGNKTGYEKIDPDDKGRPVRIEYYEIDTEDEKQEDTLTGYKTIEYTDVRLESEYDAEDKLLKTQYYDQNDVLFSESTYDGEDKLLTNVQYEDDAVVSRTVNTYDDKGRLTGTKDYDAEDKVVDSHTISYHANGEKKVEANYIGDEETIVSKTEKNDSGVTIYELVPRWDDDAENILGYSATKYDDNGREIASIEYDANMHETSREEYRYDLLGNKRLKLL